MLASAVQRMRPNRKGSGCSNHLDDDMDQSAADLADGNFFAAGRYASNSTPLQQDGKSSPQKYDVLFGRGKHHRSHAGNRILRKMCGEQRENYDNANRHGKTELTRKLVNQIINNGRRFLKYDKQQQAWLEVSEEEARLKVGHMIRDGRSHSPGK